MMIIRAMFQCSCFFNITSGQKYECQVLYAYKVIPKTGKKGAARTPRFWLVITPQNRNIVNIPLPDHKLLCLFKHLPPPSPFPVHWNIQEHWQQPPMLRYPQHPDQPIPQWLRAYRRQVRRQQQKYSSRLRARQRKRLRAEREREAARQQQQQRQIAIQAAIPSKVAAASQRTQLRLEKARARAQKAREARRVIKNRVG